MKNPAHFMQCCCPECRPPPPTVELNKLRLELNELRSFVRHGWDRSINVWSELIDDKELAALLRKKSSK
jgi:hypothetical protein